MASVPQIEVGAAILTVHLTAEHKLEEEYQFRIDLKFIKTPQHWFIRIL